MERSDERWGVKDEKDDLTDKQRNFLEYYYDTFSVIKACELTGIHSSYLYHSLKRDTTFTKKFRQLTKDLETDPRITKVGGLANLIDIAKRAKDAGDFGAELKAQAEINKMVEKNLAIQKRSTEHVQLEIKAKLDLTESREAAQITQDAEYIEVKAEGDE